MLSVREVTALLEILQNSSQTLESAASAFQRAFIKAEHFRVAAALCILIEDGLLPATKQRVRCRRRASSGSSRSSGTGPSDPRS